jgi:hypothetical protein
MRVFLVLFCVCLFLLNPVAVCFAASRTEAMSEMSLAERRTKMCYEAAADAEKAGANVTYLLEVLNDAGAFLSQAHVAYGKRDFDGAEQLALLCQESLDGFEVQAGSLGNAASNQRFWDFMVYVVGSVVGALVVVISSLGIWTLLKRRARKA